jgi:hypothetical protein
MNGHPFTDLDDAFDDFMRNTNPGVPEYSLQYKESRRCFFAGAVVMFYMTLNAARASLGDMDKGVSEIDRVKKQLDDFADRVKGDFDCD